MRYFTVGGKGDTKDVAKASHLEALETAELTDEDRPALRTVEEGWEHSGFEDADLGFN